MKEIKFNKEGKAWYVDLPDWKGPKQALLMVAGADKLLDKLCENKNSVTLIIREEDPKEEGYEKITKIMETPFVGGATYWTKYWPIWLCKVVEFIYGRMPEVLYYKVSD